MTMVMQGAPYTLASAARRPGERTITEIDGRALGGHHFAVIAGPCTVESYKSLVECARGVSKAGATFLRGGVYKPRSSPYSFPGLGRHGLDLLQQAKGETGLPIVTELMDARELDPVLEVADIIQVGARNMQNYPLLTELGRTDRPVLLKRGLAATLEELLLSAEYILKGGNERVVLCERGVRGFEGSYRFTLDLAAVPALKELTHLPVIVDPSHAAGRRSLVLPLSLAAVAAGADGLLVEVHPDPGQARCDSEQALPLAEFEDFMRRVDAVAALSGKVASDTRRVPTVLCPSTAEPSVTIERRLDRAREGLTVSRS